MDSTSQARRATSLKLRKYDATVCIIFTERYRSGHNEAVLKTVCLTAQGFESLPLRQKEHLQTQVLFLFEVVITGRGSEKLFVTVFRKRGATKRGVGEAFFAICSKSLEIFGVLRYNL